mmetsp:Transcript_49100/g.98811  ORF Transcript_49100/g.98811 Transcript_49100/m.98811 type:complete len:373 (-) Transcript_49100:305-1423(-)
MTALAPEIEDLHKYACDHGEKTYTDPSSCLQVFTAVGHKARGKCCGSTCRHCPFGYVNVPREPRGDDTLSQETSSADFKSDSEEIDSAPSSYLPVYTRTGDTGTSQLFTGERRVKDDCVFEALGSVDELAAFVGAAREECTIQGGLEDLAEELKYILSTLLDVGSNIATPNSPESRKLSSFKRQRTIFDDTGVLAVARLEEKIDYLSGILPPLTSFILASGGRASTALHISRTVCRRAERRVQVLRTAIDAPVCIYLNRLSDFLFTAARFAAWKAGHKELEYSRGGPSLVSKSGCDGNVRNVESADSSSDSLGGFAALSDALPSTNAPLLRCEIQLNGGRVVIAAFTAGVVSGLAFTLLSRASNLRFFRRAS